MKGLSLVLQIKTCESTFGVESVACQIVLLHKNAVGESSLVWCTDDWVLAEAPPEQGPSMEHGLE